MHRCSRMVLRALLVCLLLLATAPRLNSLAGLAENPQPGSAAAKSSGGKRGQRHPRAFPSAVSPGRAAADQGARYTDAHRDGRTRKAMQRPLIKETYTLL